MPPKKKKADDILLPQMKDQDPAKLEIIRKECASRNPPAVRIIGKDIEKNAALLAGYLNFSTGTVLKNFINNGGKKPCDTSTTST